MAWRLLHDDARAVLLAAAEAAARSRARPLTPEHLLAGLLQVDGSWGVAVLEQLGVSPAEVQAALGWEAASEAGEDLSGWAVYPSPALRRVFTEADAEAARMGDHGIGTEHLLAGIVAEGNSPAAQALSGLGVESDRLYEALAELRELALAQGPAPPTPPPVVIWISAALVLQGLWILIFGLIQGPLTANSAALPTVDRSLAFLLGGRDALHAPWGGAASLWTWLCCNGLAKPLQDGKRWAWSAVQGVLLVKSASCIAGLPLLFRYALTMSRHPRASSAALILLCAACVGYAVLVSIIAARLFGAREWFGVPARQGWKTLVREGWLLLVLTTAVELGYLISLALSLG